MLATFWRVALAALAVGLVGIVSLCLVAVAWDDGRDEGKDDEEAG